MMIDMAGYYDLVLGLIPLVLVGLSGGLALAGFEWSVALVTGSLLAVGLVGHAMFVRAPGSQSPERQSPSVGPASAD